MDPSAALEQLYPQSKKDYEDYVSRVLSILRTHEEKEAARRGGAAGDAAKGAGSNEWYVAALGELFAKCLEETEPEIIRALSGRVTEVCNKKIEQIAKEQGRKKVVLGGAMRLDGGNIDDIDMDDKAEAADAADTGPTEEEQAAMEERDRKAREDRERRAQEAKELQAKLMAGKQGPRTVDTSRLAGMQLKKKDDGGLDFGFGGKKKKK
eukprot:TRINITY_DN643_c0_g6_i1.p2 TRINITY_DN643_c0_g6~~TRINITY_DN643_c0_g6_i1.p2  ORF type:complete len:234 (+),score=105.98 TRINITY_DN643_c0_g6_i1:76-702(+)